MRIDRNARATSLLLTIPVGVALTIAGCGGGEGETVKVSDEAQKKTQDMLGGMQKKMQDLHKGQGKAGRKSR
jgi:hypothetical protein